MLTLAVAVVTALVVGPLCMAYGGRHAAYQSRRADREKGRADRAQARAVLAEVAADHHRDENRLLRRVLADSHGEVTSP